MTVLFIILCLIAAAAFICIEHKEKYVPAVALKGTASVFFVILGIIGSKMCADASFAKLVLWGLVLGCIADILLNLRFCLKKIGKKVFLVGILVFLAGHVMYIIALAKKCSCTIICVILGIAATAVLMYFIFKKITAEKAFKIFGIFYVGAVTIMTCIALGNYITAPSAWAGLFALGALLFLVSDVVMILNTFGKEQKFSLRITNLSLYYIGQVLIALSLQFVK